MGVFLFSLYLSIMKVIITESQFDDIVPLPLRRKFGEMKKNLVEILGVHHMGETAQKYDEDVFVNYIIEILVYESFPDENEIHSSEELESFRRIAKFLFQNQIIRFWDSANFDRYEDNNN